MEDLVNRLSFIPWRVYSGDLNLVQLVAVIKHSLLHLSGDTGPMHIALMTKTPSISWFQPTISKDWIPRGKSHKVIFGEHIEETIKTIRADRLLKEVKSIQSSEIALPEKSK